MTMLTTLCLRRLLAPPAPHTAFWTRDELQHRLSTAAPATHTHEQIGTVVDRLVQRGRLVTHSCTADDGTTRVALYSLVRDTPAAPQGRKRTATTPTSPTTPTKRARLSTSVLKPFKSPVRSGTSPGTASVLRPVGHGTPKKPGTAAFRSPLKAHDPEVAALGARKQQLEQLSDKYQRIVRNRRALESVDTHSLHGLIGKWRQASQDAAEHLRTHVDPVAFYAALGSEARATVSLRDMLHSLGLVDAGVVLHYSAHDDSFM